MRYYFHIRINGGLIPDDDGIELENDEIARKEAIRSATELRREYPPSQAHLGPQLISVVDETERQLFIVPINAS